MISGKCIHISGLCNCRKSQRAARLAISMTDHNYGFRITRNGPTCTLLRLLLKEVYPDFKQGENKCICPACGDVICSDCDRL